MKRAKVVKNPCPVCGHELPAKGNCPVCGYAPC